MYITELFEPTEPAYRTEKDDNSALKKSEPRKTRLTLQQINRLRIMNDMRRFEHEQKLKTISKQYSPPPEAAAPGL